MLSFVWVFSQDDLMQIDTAHHVKRGQYKRRIRLVKCAELDRHLKKIVAEWHHVFQLVFCYSFWLIV